MQGNLFGVFYLRVSCALSGQRKMHINTDITTPRSMDIVMAASRVRLNSPSDSAPSFVKMTKIMICERVQAT